MNIVEFLEWSFMTPLRTVLSTFVAIMLLIVIVSIVNGIVELAEEIIDNKTSQNK